MNSDLVGMTNWSLRSSILVIVASLLLVACGGESEAQQKDVEQVDTTEVPVPEKTAQRVILFYGNSLTAGYGLEESESFPMLIQKKIDSLGLDYKVVNAGLSGETSAGGLGRIDWVLGQDVDIFVLELGPNDALRGLDLGETLKNLRQIMQRVQEKHPGIPMIVAGMMAPPNMGTEFTEEFAGIYTKLAQEFDAGLIPFLLEGVAGDPELNQRDGIHPTAEGQVIVADNVWQVLQGYLSPL